MTKLASMLVLCLAAASQQALAASVSIRFANSRLTTAAEVANDPSLANKVVRQFRVSSSSDILRISNVRLLNRGGLYNNPLGVDTEPPNPAFIPVFPALGADSWITTPGPATNVTGSGGLSVDGNTWFDMTNDGPQFEFTFAQITLDTSTYLRFYGFVEVIGESGDPEIHPFAFDPEPSSSALALCGAAALVFSRKRGAERACRPGLS